MILCNFSTNIFLCRKFTLSTPANIYYFWMFKDNFNGKIVFIGKLQWPTVLDKLPMPPECFQFMQAWNVFEKVDKNIGLLRRVQNLFQRKKIIYSLRSLCQTPPELGGCIKRPSIWLGRLESVQYNSCKHSSVHKSSCQFCV